MREAGRKLPLGIRATAKGDEQRTCVHFSKTHLAFLMKKSLKRSILGRHLRSVVSGSLLSSTYFVSSLLSLEHNEQCRLDDPGIKVELHTDATMKISTSSSSTAIITTIVVLLKECVHLNGQYFFFHILP